MEGAVAASDGMKTQRIVLVVLLVCVPLAGLVILIALPDLDVLWEHHPSHFWLVLGAAAVTAILTYATGDAARRREDARVFLVSLAFLAAAGFLLLHALATPGVLLSGPNAGFAMATPVGLVICACLLAASSLPFDGGSPVMRRVTRLRVVVVAVLLLWGALSLAQLPPLQGPPPQRGSASLSVLAVLGIVTFTGAAFGYVRLYRRRPSRLLASVIAAGVLLIEAMAAVAVSRNWHASWWEWHVLMLVAFVIVAWTARTQWREERFAGLYLEDTTAGRREVSVLFADMEGFTSFSERHDPREVTEMLNALFAVAVPAVVEEHGGEVEQIIGDAIMATSNTRRHQPDHALRAARAALSLRDAAAAVAREHPEWPRLRIGVNTGEVIVGVVGTAGGRKYTVVGDAVNVAARLEQKAPAGGVVVGAETANQVPGAQLEALGSLTVKGKDDPVEAYLLTGLE